MEGFGPHLMLDGYGCDRGKLEDLDLIYKLLDEFPATIGMTKVMPPYVFKYMGVKPEDWGLSGFVLTTEGHVTIHTFPEKSFLSADILSGKRFDVELTTRFLRDTLGIAKAETNLLDRGRVFPKEREAAVEAAPSDRMARAPGA